MKRFVAEKTSRRSRSWGASQTERGVGFYFYLTWICIRSTQSTSTKLITWRHKILISWLAIKAGSALTGKCLPVVWFGSFLAVAVNSIHEQSQDRDISHVPANRLSFARFSPSAGIRQRNASSPQENGSTTHKTEERSDLAASVV